MSDASLLEELTSQRDEAESAVSRYEDRVAELERRIAGLQDCLRAEIKRREALAADMAKASRVIESCRRCNDEWFAGDRGPCDG